jgi:hypothetical protein
MDTVNINLIAYQQQFTLSKDHLLSWLPESLLGQAIAGDPDCLEVNLTNPDVTPAALQVISDWLLELGEPTGVITDLEFSAKYLNIPWLSIYSNPLYGKLDHPVEDSKTNRCVMVEAASAGDIDIVNYLLERNVCIVESREINLVQRFDNDGPYIESDTEWYSPALEASMRGGHIELFEFLRENCSDLHYTQKGYILTAIEADNVIILQHLLSETKEDVKELWDCAKEHYANKIKAYLLETYHEALDIPTLWRQAVWEDAKWFWVVHPYMTFNYPDDPDLKQAISKEWNELAGIILEDPKFTPYLEVYLNYAETKGNTDIVDYINELISSAP